MKARTFDFALGAIMSVRDCGIGIEFEVEQKIRADALIGSRHVIGMMGPKSSWTTVCRRIPPPQPFDRT